MKRVGDIEDTRFARDFKAWLALPYMTEEDAAALGHVFGASGICACGAHDPVVERTGARSPRRKGCTCKLCQPCPVRDAKKQQANDR